MESNSVQPLRLYQTCLRNKLHWDTQSPGNTTVNSWLRENIVSLRIWLRFSITFCPWSKFDCSENVSYKISDSRKLSHSSRLLLRSFVQWGWVASRIQALLASSEQNCAKGLTTETYILTIKTLSTKFCLLSMQKIMPALYASQLNSAEESVYLYQLHIFLNN